MLVLLILIQVGCREQTEVKTEVISSSNIEIPDVEVLKSKLKLNQLEGRWYYQGKPFSGFSLKYHLNDTLGEVVGYYKGKREGIAKQWSNNGVLRVQSYYKQNRLEGTYKTWWETGEVASEANYENGVLNGTERYWYPSGQLSKERNLVDGKEKGLQKAWLQNGSLYVNYEAKNGRIFGLRRANSCYELQDETVVQYE